MIDKARIEDLLRQLGGTADEVAASLRASGVTGVRGEAQCCPVANYVRSCAPADARILAGTAWLCVRRATQHVHMDMPRAVAAFIGSFDAFGYPDLDAEAGEQS